MRLVFDKVLSKDLKALIESITNKYAPHLPSWVEELTFIWVADFEDDSAIMQICMLPEYRKATLNIFPGIFDTLDLAGDIERALLHELSHLFHGPLFYYVHKVVEQVLPGPLNDTFREHVIENIRMYNEGCTQDFTKTLYDLVNQPKVSGTRRKAKK